MVKLPFDHQLVEPTSLLEWVQETDVNLVIRESDQYPRHPIHFSDYRMDPPEILVFRYRPIEEWLNTVCQQQVGFYGPYYYLFVAYRFYFHLEINGLYEVKRTWFQSMMGQLTSLEDRARYFARDVLSTRNPIERFEQFVDRSFRPGH